MASHQIKRAFLMNLIVRRQAAVWSRQLSTTSRVCGGDAGAKYDKYGGEYQPYPIKTDIGKREIVGFGYNGEENYIDSVHGPFPAIRFKEDTPEILKLKEKEKGDWKKLTIHEKKELYRASFCQTIVEHQAPTGDYKAVLGLTFWAIALSVWLYIFVKVYVYPPLPWTMTDDDYRRKMLRRMIDLRVNPIEGLASKWDYEKEEWKK